MSWLDLKRQAPHIAAVKYPAVVGANLPVVIYFVCLARVDIYSSMALCSELSHEWNLVPVQTQFQKFLIFLVERPSVQCRGKLQFQTD